MPASDAMFLIYRDLADYHERQGLDQLRDRFLVLAAASAQSAGQSDEAERLRQRLLRNGDHHLLRPFTSMAQAMCALDVQAYVEELRLEYPVHAAEDLLASVRGPAQPAKRGSTRALPPTAPVIDLDRPADPFKVYPARDEADVPILPEWDQRPRRKTSFPSPKPSRLLPAAASARPATVVVKRPTVLQSSPQIARRMAVESDDVDESAGRWLGPCLSVLVLAAALYLAGLTLLQPFLP
jgi:hypothetical protein